ncbi:MAG: triose-phosphate isomerase [Flavobacteriales bacterium]|nr:triose-phosphate isomerase [Flavobacteriales bacterium]
MRKRYVAGNWKMNTNLMDGFDLVSEVLENISETDLSNCDVAVFAPFTHLKVFQNSLNGSGIRLGAQNCHHEKEGAYTGEISAAMLASIPISSVIVGHSERRQYFGETNQQIAQKMERAFENGLEAIYCFGETLNERESNKHFEVVETQIREALTGFSWNEWSKITLAYEPVWAIGTGKTATAEQAQEIHAFVRGIVQSIAGKEVADTIRILYGGSVKPNNAAELFSMPDIDGGLIGGAALDAKSFAEIVAA